MLPDDDAGSRVARVHRRESRRDGGCAATLETGVGKLDEAELKKYFEDVEVTAIKVKGATATAKVDGEPNSLAKRGGRWLVDLNREG